MSVKCPKCQHENPDDTLYCGKCATPLNPSESFPITKTLITPVKGLPKEAIIADRYKIIEKLGEGGMGVVYKAEDKRLKRTVALKFLPPELTRNQEAKERFIREAQSAAALSHPNICTIHEIDEEEGVSFIVMEFVEGQSLREKISEGPLALTEILDITIQAAQGLEEAHKKGIIHRDIKSANIMVTEAGQAKIMDFGLAKMIGGTLITKEATTMGTVAYMSPEQAGGNAMDHRTDIWSLGIVLYEMLTGKFPFKGENEQSVIYSILNKDPEPITKIQAHIPQELENIVNRTLAKNPDKRYPKMYDILAELRAVKSDIESKATGARPPFLKDLINRRIPLFFGLYFIIIWGITQFIEWLANRYILSPYLTDFSLVALLSLVPTVFILMYFFMGYTRKRRINWVKIGVPLNLLISIALLFLIFYGKSLGAATKAVTVENEEEQIIERVIPKTEFRKNAAVFFFENDSGDSSLNWMQYAISHLLSIDLSQDLFLNVLSGYSFFGDMKREGFLEGVGVPLTQKKKISDDFHKQYFISSSLTKQNEEYLVRFSLYEAKRARLLAERSVQSKDIFKLIDELSVMLKGVLKIPKRHIEEVKDLPISDITTNSITALKLYISGLNAKHNQEWEKSIDYFEQSVKEDPTFAIAYFELQERYAYGNQSAKREKAFQSLMKYHERLPERYQFQVKSDYFFLKKDSDKQLKVVKMWSEIYPEDTLAHVTLARLYEYRNQLDEALAAYRRVLELDPKQYDVYFSVGSILHLQNDFEGALKYYEQYAEQFPMDIKSYTTLGDLYRDEGDFEKSKVNYEKALLLEPERVAVNLELADIYTKLGDFEKARAQYVEALKLSNTFDKEMSVYDKLMGFHEMRGQLSQTLEYMHSKWDLAEKNLPKASALLGKLTDVVFYARAGKSDVAFKTIEEIKSQMAPPWDGLLPIGYLALYLEMNDANNAERILEDYEKFIESFGFENLRFMIPYSQGVINKIRGNCEEAISLFQKSLDRAPSFHILKANRDIGKCYRKLQDFEKAEAYLNNALKYNPYDPKLHYELALVYLDAGKKEKAFDHLNIALDVWKDADLGIAEVDDARKRLAGLKE